MQEVTLIFPHQLFEENPAVSRERPVCLVEEWLFFQQYRFHKQKLVLHRASMKMYEACLKKKGFHVRYIESSSEHSDIRQLLVQLSAEKISVIHYTDTVDNWLEKRIQQSARRYGIKTKIYPSPNFLNRMPETAEYFRKRKTYFQTDFYIDQRKKRELLLEPGQRPLGGKWTFDRDNRLKFPRHKSLPSPAFPQQNAYVKEALQYVQTNFAGNYGSVEEFHYPVTHADAVLWLDDFLEQRFVQFGDYEDAMLQKESILHHSVLTPLLNIGLLNPQQVLDKALPAATNYEVPLNSLEGFIRQVVGWREFIRIVYEREGSYQRRRNFWGFHRKIPPSFWLGETGIHPVDTVVRRLWNCGYTHHIERLMVLGNFMLLCEFDPDEVYRWFMEMYVDSYDWVMVPNVYGMTQFADGGLMTTKPYISGSNYLLKMGDWDKGPWQETWDGLFWRFMQVHRDYFLSNPRLGMLIRTFDKMPAEKQRQHLARAEAFLKTLDT